MPATPQPSASSLIGLSWLYVLHAHASIERHKLWQADYWISGIREHVLELACLRLGENARERRGVDHLPSAVTGPLAETLVCSLDEPELRRALAATITVATAELGRTDPALTGRLRPMLTELAG